jgi:hypothetical protein
MEDKDILKAEKSRRERKARCKLKGGEIGCICCHDGFSHHVCPSMKKGGIIRILNEFGSLNDSSGVDVVIDVNIVEVVAVKGTCLVEIWLRFCDYMQLFLCCK